MVLAYDAKRLFNNFTGLGNYSRFIVGSLLESHPENNYHLYTTKVKQHADVNAIASHGSVTIHTPQGIRKFFKSAWRSYSIAIAAQQSGAAVFHGLSNELPLVRPRRLRTVVTIHDVIFKRFPDFYKPADRWIYDRKFRHACATADAIIAVSEQTARDAEEFLDADRAKIKVIYQGCNPIFKQVYPADVLADVRKKYGLPKEYILSVGTIESRKNVLLLLQALALLEKKVPVVIAGRATPYKRTLEVFVKEKKLERWVTFIDHATFADLPLIYQNASAFVYPSLFEGFGIPIVEAIHSGIPVVTSTGSCFQEAGGASAWYVDPNSAEQLADTLNSILGHTLETQRRVEEAKRYVARFEPNVIADDVITLYRSLV